MMNMQWEEFWWDSITGPRTVVSNVVKALLENKMVILKVPPDLPWRHPMRSAINTAFKEHSDYRDIVIEHIDIIDDNPKQMEPGRFILNYFASSAVNNGYREKSKASIQEYISMKGVIKNRIIWIKGLDKKTTEKWIKFCCGFTKRSPEEGLFVLEVHADSPLGTINSLTLIDFMECVSNYDLQLFNSFVLDKQSYYTDNWKKYISVCSATVCDIDAELSELLIRIIDFKTESVLEGIKRIAEMPDFVRRGEDISSNHILRYYRNNNFSEIEHRIWTAQIQVLFPIIELERVEIICKYENAIKSVLDSENITQYGELLTDAIDVELGTLCYLMSKRNNDGLYYLYIPNETDRDRIRFLHECRNNLAHVSCCSPKQVRELLN